MNCPHCNTQNDPANQFCLKCGHALRESSPSTPPSASGLLAIYIARMLVTLLLVWMIRAVLLRLPFMQNLRLPPEIPLSVADLVNSITYLIVLALLIGFAQAIWATWPRAFPQAAGFTPALAALLYVLALIAFNSALVVPLLALTREPDVVLGFQILLALLAAGLLIWLVYTIYAFLPAWLLGFRHEVPSTGYPEVLCSACGRPNPAGMSYCGHCGQSLTRPSAAVPTN